jgi:DNA-binding FadR family transcriptional regulator
VSRLRRGTKVPETVARAILREIVRSELPPGAKLPPEHVLQEQYGVARSSLREALRILEAQGLIVMRTGAGGGPVVGEVNPEVFGRAISLHLHMAKVTFEQLADARQLIEPVLARRAAENPPSDLLQALAAALEAEGEATAAGDPVDTLAHCRSFHRVITQISGNPLLDLFAGGLKEMFDDQLPDLAVSHAVRAETAEAHSLIARAIVAGDPDGAEALMRAHMSHIIGLLKQRNEALLGEIIGWRY